MKISSGHASQAVSHEQGADNVSAGRAIGGDDALALVASLAKNQMSIFHSSPADFMHTGGEHRCLKPFDKGLA